MTVVCYDGISMAADKQSNFAGLRVTTTKIKSLPDGTLLGAAGNSSIGRGLIRWFADGAKPADYPDTRNECQLLVVSSENVITLYEEGPYPIVIEDKKIAIGSGRDFALAAMACGKSSYESVELTNKFENTCGLGVDVLFLKET